MEKIESKINNIWDFFKIDSIYNIFTKVGNYRWWRSYSEDKKVLVLSWKVEFISFDWKKDIKKYYEEWEFFNIPLWINHIFYFSEDYEMIEIFPISTIADKFERYYNLK